jgi:hypothetical protein
MIRIREFENKILERFESSIRRTDSKSNYSSSKLEFWSNRWAVTVRINIERESNMLSSVHVEILDGDFEDVDYDEFLLAESKFMVYHEGLQLKDPDEAKILVADFVETYIKNYL